MSGRVRTVCERLPHVRVHVGFGGRTRVLVLRETATKRTRGRAFKLAAVAASLALVILLVAACLCALGDGYFERERAVSVVRFRGEAHLKTAIATSVPEAGEPVCDSCGGGEVCLQNPGELGPRCVAQKDPDDPTGCGGVCAVDKQRCAVLDRVVGIRACLPVLQAPRCAAGQFPCAGTCVPERARCDGLLDCPDASDERGCECDPRLGFRCGGGTSCVANSRRCDGSVDCWDATDELGCTKGCSQDYFPCLRGGCVPRESLCDGVFDCTDRSDEPEGCAVPFTSTESTK